MDPRREARLVTGKGIAGGVDRSRRRQVTLLEREVWDRVMRDLHATLDPSTRRANLLVTGIALRHSRGRILRIGQARLLLGGEVTPCERMDDALLGLRAALAPAWGGGAFAQVLDGGVIRVGDSIAWDEDDAAPATSR
jgi:MOSC domain-containing protein YiiM